MMDYFLKLTSTSAGKHEVFQNFQHEFFEATYFHLTYCDWCEKVVGKKKYLIKIEISNLFE